MADPLRLGILVSGRGSNLQAILAAISAQRLRAEVRVVVSDRAGAPALAHAEAARVPVVVLDPGTAGPRLTVDAEAELVEVLQSRGVELVVLAGFMRILRPVTIAAFPDAIINIHPSLLPAFPGLDAQRQALEHGVKVTGCTVHFVEAGAVDGGAIIAQAAGSGGGGRYS